MKKAKLKKSDTERIKKETKALARILYPAYEETDLDGIIEDVINNGKKYPEITESIFHSLKEEKKAKYRRHLEDFHV